MSNSVGLRVHARMSVSRMCTRSLPLLNIRSMDAGEGWQGYSFQLQQCMMSREKRTHTGQSVCIHNETFHLLLFLIRKETLSTSTSEVAASAKNSNKRFFGLNLNCSSQIATHTFQEHAPSLHYSPQIGTGLRARPDESRRRLAMLCLILGLEKGAI